MKPLREPQTISKPPMPLLIGPQRKPKKLEKLKKKPELLKKLQIKPLKKPEMPSFALPKTRQKTTIVHALILIRRSPM